MNLCDLFFQVAWLRVDTQTILTIHSHVITKNHRISVTHTDEINWYLKIKDVRETDRGFYMCQINTDPMKSQIGYLDVVGTEFSTFVSLLITTHFIDYFSYTNKIYIRSPTRHHRLFNKP